MFLAYNALLILALPGILVYHCWRAFRRGRPAALSPRFGLETDLELAALAEKGPIWVHAVSVGETMAVKPLLAALKQAYPGRPLILSHMTETGRSVARTIGSVDHCLYFPFDYPGAVRRVLTRVRPSLVVIMETEIWPNFLRVARQLDIPTVIVNGRISDRSLGRYLRLRSFFRPVLAQVTTFCMQTAEDARRIEAIGADPARVRVCRNLKYDIPTALPTEEERADLRAAYRLPDGIPVFTAGSTHPGEETAVLEAFRSLLATGQEAVLVLVPRHPERAGEVAALVPQAGLPCRRRSQLDAVDGPLESCGVLLVDTVGELMRLYAVSDLVFVGGSLVAVGGHNVLEPASLGVAVLFGPHMSNFREIAAMMVAAGSGIQLADGSELARQLVELLRDKARRLEMGQRGRQLLLDNSGATERHLAAIAELLPIGKG